MIVYKETPISELPKISGAYIAKDKQRRMSDYRFDGTNWRYELDGNYAICKEGWLTHWLKPIELSSIIDEQDKWVSVKDKLPKLNSIVLSLGESGIKQTKYITFPKGSIGYSDGHRDRWFEYITHNNFCMPHSNVTHWQPLPNQPKQ